MSGKKTKSMTHMLGSYSFLRNLCLYFDLDDASVQYNIYDDSLSYIFMREPRVDNYDDYTEEDILDDLIHGDSLVVQVDFSKELLETLTVDTFLTIISIEIENTMLGERTIIH